jgi:hypothetical protein
MRQQAEIARLKTGLPTPEKYVVTFSDLRCYSAYTCECHIIQIHEKEARSIIPGAGQA